MTRPLDASRESRTEPLPLLAERTTTLSRSLLRELIVEATRIPIEYDVDSRDGRVMALIVDEICSAQRTPLHVPMPHHAKLVRVCHAILKDPAQNDVLDDWAVAAGMSRRTFVKRMSEFALPRPRKPVGTGPDSESQLDG